MSREAIGENGAVLGSGEYWSRVNRSTFFGGLMRRASEASYQETLRETGSRASDMVEEIHEDLQEHKTRLSSIDYGRRNALAKQVQGLYDVCRMADTSCTHSGECITMLNLSSLFGNPFSDERAIEAAIRKVKNNPDFFASECIDLIEKAADWGIAFAAGSSEKKRAFLEDVAQGKGKDFLQEVADAYQAGSDAADTRGKCGHSIGSREYLDRMERVVFRQDVPTMYSARWGSPDYDGLLKSSLESIAHQLDRDLERNERENNYITDDTAKELKLAVGELERCGINTGSASSKIEKLAWFVGGDPAKIRELQSKLNQLGIGEHLNEDGVYGGKTLAAWERLIKNLEHGTVPTLAWIDPLQNNAGLMIAGSNNMPNNSIADVKTGYRYLRIDTPHISKNGAPHKAFFRGEQLPIDYNHLNVDFGNHPTALQSWLKKRYNHYPLSDSAYDMLKDLKSAGKKVRVAGKVLLVAGIALDVLELGTTIDADLKDADRKLGKTTLSTAVGIGGSWAGAALGAKLGALAGVAAGPAAFITVPVLSLAGGIVGALGGDALGRYIVDITCTED
ncbi:hypothetical protein [Oscillibacter sp.]|uniref:hypothetical protein n=1 Tax=Oscillibacter sp. TaxID=1945593 RepID=UPI00289C8FF9|nr:hypothetical protein [Oscillibacter sp.]